MTQACVDRILSQHQRRLEEANDKPGPSLRMRPAVTRPGTR